MKNSKRRFIFIIMIFSFVSGIFAKNKSQDYPKIKSGDKMLTVQAMQDGLHIKKKHRAMFTRVEIHVVGKNGENFSISTDEKTNVFIYPFVTAGEEYSVYLTLMDKNWGNWTQSKPAVITAAGGLGDVRECFDGYYYDNDTMSIVLENYSFEKPENLDLLAHNFCGNIYFNQEQGKINWSKATWGNYILKKDIKEESKNVRIDISSKGSDFANTNFFIQLETKFAYNDITYHTTLISNEKNLFTDTHPLKNVTISQGLLVPPFNPACLEYKIKGTENAVKIIPEFIEDVETTKQIHVIDSENSTDSIDFAFDGQNYSYKFTFEKGLDFNFDGKNYIQTFYDDFDGNEINSANWKKSSEEERQSSQENHGWWSNECSYLDGQGNLIIEAKYKNGQRLSGAIESQTLYEQSHGFYEIKFKCDKTSGLWYAFWLMGDNDEEHVGNGATDAAEIDIFELVPDEPYNGPNYFKTTINWDSYGTAHKAVGSPLYRVPDDFYNQWHIAQFVWGETSYKLWLDGQLLYEMDASQVDDAHYGGMCDGINYMIISSEFGSWGGAFDKSQLPAKMYVDYVKVGVEK